MDVPRGIICPGTVNSTRVTFVVDSAADVTCLSIQGAASLGLTIVSDPRTFVPCGDDNEVKSPGYVEIAVLRVGSYTLRNLQVPVCDVHSCCSPALGLLGLDLFPRLGITVTGVPVNYPREDVDDDEIAM